MVIFDLETIPREQLSEQLLLYRSESVPVKELKIGNLKDPDKILAKKEEVDRENAKAKSEFQLMDGVDVDYCQVITAGILSTERAKLIEILDGEEVEEIGGIAPVISKEENIAKELIQELNNTKGPFIGFNIKGFDIPILKRLKLRYMIDEPLPFTKENVIDLMEVLKVDYRTAPKKLIEYGMIYGAKVDLSIADASKIHQWYLDNEFSLVSRHLEQDLQICNFLYHKMVATHLIEVY